MTNKHKASVQLISWGAGIQSIKVPNQSGILGDVVLGFDDIEGKRGFSKSIINRPDTKKQERLLLSRIHS